MLKLQKNNSTCGEPRRAFMSVGILVVLMNICIYIEHTRDGISKLFPYIANYISRRKEERRSMAKLLLGATPEPRSYTDFEPRSQWIQADDTDTLLVDLPGFQKEHLKVVISTSGSLKISGERPVDGDRWLRFLKHLTVPKHCNPKGIHAKFDKEEGLLYVVLPKLASQGHASQDQAAGIQKPTENEREDAPEAPQKDGEQRGERANPQSGTAPGRSVPGMTGTVMRFGKRRLLLVNVVAVVMVLVGVGVYLGFKRRLFGGDGSN